MFNAVKTALGMFTKLPVKSNWDENNGAKALCFFPLCGLVCGAATALVLCVLKFYSVPNGVYAFLTELSLFAVCGFLHLDGYMDVADAIFSSRDREGKIKILKDSNVGAFSVVVVGLTLIGIYAAFGVIAQTVSFYFFLLVPFISRSLAAFVLFTFKPLSETGLLAYFRNGKKKVYPYLMLLFALVAVCVLLCCSLKYALAALGGCAGLMLLSLSVKKQLSGINGDVIGAGVIFCEFISYLLLSVL